MYVLYTYAKGKKVNHKWKPYLQKRDLLYLFFKK